VKLLGSFFKKLFKDDTENITHMDEIDVLQSVSNELMAENHIVNINSPVITNKLPEFSHDLTSKSINSFSKYQILGNSHTGMVREHNQDSIFTGVFSYKISNISVNAGIGIVADGMGGLSMGEIASSTAITSVSTYLNARLSEYIQNILNSGSLPHSRVIMEHINDAMVNANKILWDKGSGFGESIGTTFTGVFLLGNVAYFGHVGDSRAYIIDKEKKSIEKVTRDHSLVGRLIEMGSITDKEAKSHPRRNEIYKMLGLRNVIEVDTYYRIINKNSIILIMSDGLWEFVDDSEMLDEILKSNDLLKSIDTLIDKANENGGHDNISLVITKPIE
jgi:PPM family protein phosphatase